MLGHYSIAAANYPVFFFEPRVFFARFSFLNPGAFFLLEKEKRGRTTAGRISYYAKAGQKCMTYSWLDLFLNLRLLFALSKSPENNSFYATTFLAF